MPFFKALATVGVTKNELAVLDNQQIIRLEKKLLAEQRLNNSISKNEVEKIVTVIRQYPDVIQMLCRYDCLYGILAGYETENIDLIEQADVTNGERIRHVISNYFKDELNDYINVNISSNNWNNIRVLLHYEYFLSKEIFRLIYRRLESKFDQALGIMSRHPWHYKLKKQLNYLRTDEFYYLLAQVDQRKFSTHIARLLKFIAANESYAARTIFFDNVLTALLSYNPYDRMLDATIRQSQRKYGGQKWITHAFLSGIAFIIILFIIFLVTRPTVYSHRTNSYANKSAEPARNNDYEQLLDTVPYQFTKTRGTAYDNDSVKEDQKIKLEDFIEARLYPLSYPLNSWKAKRMIPAKYDNPFSLDIFSRYYPTFKSTSKPVNIFNKTDKECIVIAYCYYNYDFYEKKYSPIAEGEPLYMYAIYIPPRDSITIDREVQLFRFYMGKWLAGFNAYRKYIYPDYNDLKFSKFTQSDSLLFSKGFFVQNWPDDAKYSINLSILQPNPNTYQISWNGPQPLQQRYDWMEKQDLGASDTISAMPGHPILMDLRKRKIPVFDYNGGINTFLN